MRAALVLTGCMTAPMCPAVQRRRAAWSRVPQGRQQGGLRRQLLRRPPLRHRCALNTLCHGCTQSVLQHTRRLSKHFCVRTRSTSQVHRAGVYRFANGDTFSGTFEADHPSGHGIYTTKLREHLEGEFHDGQVHGWGVRILPDGAMAAGEALLPATPSSADPSVARLLSTLLYSMAGLARRTSIGRTSRCSRRRGYLHLLSVERLSLWQK